MNHLDVILCPGAVGRLIYYYRIYFDANLKIGSQSNRLGVAGDHRLSNGVAGRATIAVQNLTSYIPLGHGYSLLQNIHEYP